MPDRRVLLSIVELGGYPDFTAEYQQAGFEVVSANSMRKALSLLKTVTPDVVVAEFNFQSDFRDRTSSLESLLATLQSRHPEAKVVVFYEKEYAEQFERLRSRFPVHETFTFPVERERLLGCLERIG